MKNSKFSKALSFYKKNSWKLGVLILAILLFRFFIQKNEFNSNSEETYGKIYEVNRIVSGRRVSPLYKYKFWFIHEGKKHYGESTKTLKGNNNIGKIFKVKFLPNEPKKHEILFNQEYVEKYIIDKNGEKKTFYLKKTKYNNVYN